MYGTYIILPAVQVALVLVGILIRVGGSVSLDGAAAVISQGFSADAAAAALRQNLGTAALLASSLGYCIFGVSPFLPLRNSPAARLQSLPALVNIYVTTDGTSMAILMTSDDHFTVHDFAT